LHYICLSAIQKASKAACLRKKKLSKSIKSCLSQEEKTFKKEIKEG